MSHTQPRPQPRPQPHPLALFSLIPLNTRTAEGVINHPENDHLVSLVPAAINCLNEQEVPRGLNIGFNIESGSSYTLATIGRDGDITVQGSSISRLQCSFEIHKDTQEILLYDRSISRSTQTFGPKALPFELGRPTRRVVVTRDVNDQFGFGGVGCNLFRFKIIWHRNSINFQERIAHRIDRPRFTRTANETPTGLPPEQSIRYYKKGEIGSGSFGQVFKAVDIDSGMIFALKLLKWPAQRDQSREFAMLKREVETFARTSHPNIVEFIAAQGFGGTHLEIFTALKEGNIEDLIEKNLFAGDPSPPTSLFRQMLQALDYLAFKGIVHRDVKPANILYQSLSGGDYTYQLADFGLCNLIVDAKSLSGTPKYMAPEFYSRDQQTSKVDVWSLYATLAYVLNANGFRTKRFDTPRLCIKAVEEVANDYGFHPIQEMAAVNPEARASAADMLDKHFGGEGRSTPRN
ncbi:kinase-like domain-containing protein [Phaeosphaeriaceae sp. PMI808]|nr:kinase-like domain-containing protein [Phaeosphaeriaceae sp. PMI808]